ncbi:hypothetical protein ACFE04_028576 [Oxalis oulophora]
MAISSLHVTIDNCVYMSAPSTPNNGEHRHKVCFFSAPNSPTGSDLHSQRQPLKAVDEELINSGFDDFEFETSHKSNAVEEAEEEEVCEEATEDHQSFVKAWTGYRQRPRGESMPAISFVGEHFVDDEKMIQVKPPPRLHSISSGSPASPRSHPMSPTSVFKFPFMMRHHKNLWNDDFDPFMEALKNTVEEQKDKKTHRRTRSMLPLRSYYSWKKTEPETHTTQPEINDMTSPVKEESTQTPLGKLSEPRGVVYCRRARLVKVGQEMKTGGHSGSKRHSKLKKFLLKILYESSKQKGQMGNTSKKINQSTAKYSLKLTQINEEEDECDMTKMTLTRYKQPKLSLCMGGYAGMKYVK